jgi:cobalt/nickel transport system permease protein
MREAYQLRSGGARALKPAAWGSFAGLLLLRAADRATRVQEAVVLRGYRPEMSICRQFANDGVAAAGWMWFVFWLAYFVFVRMFDPVGVLGGLFLQLWF